MYTCITDPDSGKRLYADIAVRARCTGRPFRLEDAKAIDVVTEDEFASAIARELRGVKIRDPTLLTAVLKEAFNISVEHCPQIVKAVEDKVPWSEVMS